MLKAAPRTWWIVIGVAVGFTIGCGDSSETTSATGGTGGMGASGAGGSGAAGIDGGGTRDVRAPSAQGSVSLHLSEPTDDRLRCSPGRQWANAPSTPVLNQAQQTSGSDIGTRAVDGVEESHVGCAVQKSGDKFAFVADITTPRTYDGQSFHHPTVLHFQANAIAASGPAAQGTVSVMTDTTLANYQDDQCSFSVTAQGSASSLDVGAGKIWASVTCEHLAHPTSPDDECIVDTGFLVFENCVQ